MLHDSGTHRMRTGVTMQSVAARRHGLQQVTQRETKAAFRLCRHCFSWRCSSSTVSPTQSLRSAMDKNRLLWEQSPSDTSSQQRNTEETSRASCRYQDLPCTERRQHSHECVTKCEMADRLNKRRSARAKRKGGKLLLCKSCVCDTHSAKRCCRE